MDPVTIGVVATGGVLGVLGLALRKAKRPRARRAGEWLRRAAKAVLTFGARK